jgi:hypothetical protein
VSADYGTEHFKGYHHDGWIHVTYKDSGESALGSFTPAEIAELADLAGQAWPGGPGVEVRYVIECRRPSPDPRRWRAMWSAVADDTGGGDTVGVSEEFAEITYDGFAKVGSDNLEWRLVRRTTLTADETLKGEEGTGE